MWLWVCRVGRLLPIAARRLRTNAGLALAALLALCAAVALCVSVPVYADAASLRLLREELERREAQSGRPALAVLVRYLGSWNGPLEWPVVVAADERLHAGGALADLGLPVSGVTRHVRTAPLPIALAPDAAPLLNLSLGLLDIPATQLRIVEGATPGTGEVLISRALAERVGLNVGDILHTSWRAGRHIERTALRVAGVWVPADPRDPAWIYNPDAFDEVLLLAPAAFADLAGSEDGLAIEQAAWLARYTGAGLNAASAAPLAERVERLRITAESLIPGARLEQSPAAALGNYRDEAAILSARLLIFGAPTLALVLLFAILTAGQLVERRSAEIALLKTRGVRDGQILGLFVIEWLIIGAGALLLGIPAGLAVAGVIARTSGFLRFAADLPAVDLALTPSHLTPGLIALAIALAATLAPAAAASRRTLADIQRQSARPRAPLWERVYLDLLLLPPALYSLYRLRAPNAGAPASADPLLLLAPALLSLSLGLLGLRLLPPLLAGAAQLAARPTWIAPLIALRNLARRPAAARGPLLLLILTVSMAIFSAAVAVTSAAELQQAVAYRVGAATQLLETGQSTEQPGQDGQGEQRDISAEPRFLFVPVSEHLRVPGISAASRVGRYSGRLRNTDVQLIGIDRLTFPEVVQHYDRTWSGGTPLTELMNRLAHTPDGVIVSESVLDNGLRIGDRLTLTAELFGDRRDLEFTIVGVVELFPGFYPQEGPLVIADLDAIFDGMGGQYPYDVWIARDPSVPPTEIAAGVRALGIDLIDLRDAAATLRAEQAAPQRQGLFGLLSIGFLTATTLTVLGFVIGSWLGARRQAVELSVLRALGLPGATVARTLALEQVILIGVGGLLGCCLGLLNTLLIVPGLRVGAGPFPGTPPTVPQIAWGELGLTAALVGVSLLIALGLLGLALRRMHLFEAIKLGDAN